MFTIQHGTARPAVVSSGRKPSTLWADRVSHKRGRIRNPVCFRPRRPRSAARTRRYDRAGPFSGPPECFRPSGGEKTLLTHDLISPGVSRSFAKRRCSRPNGNKTGVYSWGCRRDEGKATESVPVNCQRTNFRRSKLDATLETHPLPSVIRTYALPCNYLRRMWNINTLVVRDAITRQ